MCGSVRVQRVEAAAPDMVLNDAAQACALIDRKYGEQIDRALRSVGARPSAARSGIRRGSRRVRCNGFLPGDPDLSGSTDHQARTRPRAVDSVSSSSLKREILGIALLLFAVFLAGAFVAARGRAGASGAGVDASIRRVRLVGDVSGASARAFFGWPAAISDSARPGGPRAATVRPTRVGDRSLVDDLLRGHGRAAAGRARAGAACTAARRREPRRGHLGRARRVIGGRVGSATFGAWVVVALAASVLMAATLAWNPIRALVGHRRADRRASFAEPSAPRPARRCRSAGRSGGAGDRRRRRSRADARAAAGGDAGDRSDACVNRRWRRRSTLDSRGRIGRSERRSRRRRPSAEHDAEIAAAIDATAHADRRGRRAAAARAARAAPPRNSDASKRELDAMGAKLMDALRTFRVDGELVGRTTGPVVTQFEIEPAPGVKVRQFANLSNDLALAMRAPRIRIVAPIPGRGAVGVEVPNPTSGDGVVPRADRVARVPERARRAADRARQGSRGQAGHRRSGEDAAPADRRRDGLGQIGLREHDHHEPGVPAHAADAALPDGRSEDGRAVGVQHAAAPAAQGRSRTTATRRRCSSGR